MDTKLKRKEGQLKSCSDDKESGDTARKTETGAGENCLGVQMNGAFRDTQSILVPLGIRRRCETPSAAASKRHTYLVNTKGLVILIEFLVQSKRLLS